ncbi:hypothetical protein VHEMI04335 [[Torrubiella] hemipterigena]|uniref:Zn(2)-C6 fungal-type domain-containing protein n=1 Tax=[Torrubiella] hemipterigena TaxID=1531966 RepID=A0A0A1TDI6_9HYPO|nr:hypothetical protein VHEMI04335 [[Torrubiella] hemipterigena]
MQPQKCLRRSAPKVRTGCRTCKIRRIKCDQQKPRCKRCTLAKFQCDGYALVSLAETALEDTKRSKALRFYLRNTRQQLGTFVSDELWEYWIPQIVHAEPCLRDAVAVLSLCHEDYISGRRSATDRQSTLLLYNRAIEGVRSSRHDVVLISLLSCAIFICVEILRGQHKSVIRLLRCGCAFLREAKQSTVVHGNTIIDRDSLLNHLAAFFIRMSAQISWLFYTPVPMKRAIPDALIPTISPSQMISTKGHFRSLGQARDALAYIVLRLVCSSSMPSEPTKFAPDVLEALRQWWVAFEPYRSRSSRRNAFSNQAGGIALLTLQYHVLAMESAATYTNGTIVGRWLQSTPETYREMLSCAETAVQEAKKKSESPGTPIFHTDVGIGPLVFQILLRCGDPDIRQQCVEIMSQCNSQEGVYNGALAKGLVEKLDAVWDTYEFVVAQPGATEEQMEVTVLNRQREAILTTVLPL